MESILFLIYAPDAFKIRDVTHGIMRNVSNFHVVMNIRDKRRVLWWNLQTSEEPAASVVRIEYPEDGGSRCLRNTRKYFTILYGVISHVAYSGMNITPIRTSDIILCLFCHRLQANKIVYL